MRSLDIYTHIKCHSKFRYFSLDQDSATLPLRNKYSVNNISKTGLKKSCFTNIEEAEEGQSLKKQNKTKTQLHSLGCRCICQNMKDVFFLYLKTRLSLASPIQLHASVSVSPCPLHTVLRSNTSLMLLRLRLSPVSRRASHREFKKLVSKQWLKKGNGRS